MSQLCKACQDDCHEHHRPELGGICIGCTCEEGGWQDGTVRVWSA